MDRRLKEEFLTCIICQEVFRDPITLHCGHTLCSQCVTAFTKTQHKSVEDKCIPCPHCRALTKVPDPDQPVDQWAGQLKTGFFVKGLVETFLEKKTGEEFCTPCKDDGEQAKATVWCGDCEKSLCSDCQKVHRKLHATHSVCDLAGEQMKSTLKDMRKVMCDEHTDSCIDMMCEKCDIAVCPRCCIEKHRSCMESVVKLTEAQPRIRSVLEKRALHLEEVIETRKKEIPVLKAQMDTLMNNSQQTKEDIKSLVQKIAAAATTVLTEKLQSLKKQTMTRLEDDLVSATTELQVAQQNEHLVKEALKSPSEMARYELYKTCPQNDEMVRSRCNATRVIMMELKYSEEPEILLKVVDLKPVLEQKQLIAEKPRAVLLQSTSAVFDCDKTIPRLHDIVAVEANNVKTVIVSDTNNTCIKAFHYLGNRKSTSYLQLNNYPVCLTVLGGISTKVAATVPESHQIITFDITPVLVLDTQIKTQKPYHGLRCLDSTKFVALDGAGGYVDVIDMSGTVLRTLCPGCFQYPGRVLKNASGDLFITDAKQGHIKAITDEGESLVVFSDHLSSTRGLSKSMSGEYFVVDEVSAKVIQFTEDGRFVKEILLCDDIKQPSGLCFDMENLMYVATRTGCIYVYTFA